MEYCGLRVWRLGDERSFDVLCFWWFLMFWCFDIIINGFLDGLCDKFLGVLKD